MKAVLLAAALPLMSSAANYSAQTLTIDGVAVVRLTDARHKTEVSVAPSLGNNSYEMNVNGKNVFWSPYKSVGEFKAKPAHLGNPFLAPWANRLDQEAFWANGKKYALNPELKNYRKDGSNQPIHGLIVYASEWKVVEAKADDSGAWVTSRLEFWRNPDWMAQFPFAHNIDMTYRLQDGVLEVKTVVENLSSQPMPLSVGYHPYFKIHDAPRDQWTVQIPAKQQVVLGPTLVPTGELKPSAHANPLSLSGNKLDDVFSGLTRGESGRAEFWVKGKNEKISVMYGPKYPVAVVYAPPGRDFVCFEPMTGPTNAFNLAQQGKYNELQTVPAGGKWQESFWIQATGF